MRDYFKAVVVVETSGGTSADDLVISVNQATSNTGTRTHYPSADAAIASLREARWSS
jgi:hypothetical protein